jgi:hypothetical protein
MDVGSSTQPERPKTRSEIVDIDLQCHIKPLRCLAMHTGQELLLWLLRPPLCRGLL